MRETWYVLEDGSLADPSEVSPDKNGVLKHKGGSAVAMKGNVPHSRGVDDPEGERAKRSAPPQKDRQLKAENEGKYKTRGVNSRD